MTQIQRSFTLLSFSSSASFLRANPSFCLPRPHCIMSQLQCRALQSHLPFEFPHFGSNANQWGCSRIAVRKGRVFSLISVNRSLSLVERPKSVGCGAFRNALSYWSLNAGATLNSLEYGCFVKRHFTQVSALANKKKATGGFVKFWKRKKLAHRNKVIPNDSSETLVSDSAESLAQKSEIIRDEEAGGSALTSDNNDLSKLKNARRKKKQKSERGEKAEDRPTQVINEQEIAGSQSTNSASQSKKSNSKKNGCSKEEASEKISSGIKTEEVQSTKKSRTLNRKKKSAKADNKSAQKQESQNVTKAVPFKQGTKKPLYPPTGKSVVVVESVTKAKAIQGYLGDMYEVLPSYGHVRDLAARSGSVRPDEDFSMVWEVPSAAWTYLKSIKFALSGAENLILASDPDREGEAIAWHIIEMLEQQDALHRNISVARVVFHEITESSIKSALQNPRDIDVNLVHAYLARRALDYLIGFNISPLLWRKLPGCQSAGRVQSAALSLICDREMEIDEFKPQEYWSVVVRLTRKEPDSVLCAFLSHFASQKLHQLSISSHNEAKDIEKRVKCESFNVIGSKTSKIRRNPPTPYITSTLQQDAANKLDFSTMYTMKVAQKLYEGVQLSEGKITGLITYMRTDGLHISDDAVKDIHSLVVERYGQDFAAVGVRKYFKKVKNAQEAHEAIRPTDIRLLPSMLSRTLDGDSLKLYTLIWCRTLACQMEPAAVEQLQVDIGESGKSIVFRSSSSKVAFPGYQVVYEDVEAKAIKVTGTETHDREEVFQTLKSLKLGDPLNVADVEVQQNFTQPPARYSEASLVKKLEELGIGRPSTYASTLKVLKDRNYVTVKSRVLHPEFRGRMVSAFLAHHFTEVTEYSFTADMETELDNVSAGLTEWKGLLQDYWRRFSLYCNRTENVHIHQVEKMLEKKFGDFLFASLPDSSRTCPSCMEGTLIFKVSRFGAGYFIGCNQHPSCKYIAKTLYGDNDDDEEETSRSKKSLEEPKLLGLHPVSIEKILLKNGPYGHYVQLGEDRKGYIPKRASLSHLKDVDAITLENALDLLRYPLTLGNHPESGQPVVLKIGKSGFTVRHVSTMASVPKNMKPDDVTLEKALELLSSSDVRRCGRPKGKSKREKSLEALEAV